MRGTTLRERIETSLREARKPLAPTEIFERITNPHPLNQQTKKQAYYILSCEARKPDGMVVRTEQGYDLRAKVELRSQVIKELRSHGFELSDGELEKPTMKRKEDIRKLHATARAEKYRQNLKFLKNQEDDLLNHFADGDEVDVDNLWPRFEVVKSETEASDLFRYATLLWSVPVSQGFGRRVRFLIWDEHTDKLIGLFALGDPVFNLSCRDNWVGWDHRDRAKRLYNVMDIFVLGAVPPFNILLGGKLVAMLACSNEVQNVIKRRYKGTESIIQKTNKSPRLALLTTGSALGKSALYDRIRYGGRTLYQRIGETKGWGHFHLNNGLFEDLKTYLDATVEGNPSNRFGAGPNWKMRTARIALRHLDLPADILQHGIRREIYAVPLARNFDSFLRGEENRLRRFDLPFDRLAEYWRERWLVGRVKRKSEYKDFKREIVSKRIHEAGLEPAG